MSYGEYAELLSYREVDLAVDRLLRALLDTKLVGIRVEAHDGDTYDKKVKALREEWLTGPKKINRAWGYLYWFDIRAKYWKDSAADEPLADVLAKPEALRLIYDHALLLQSRLGLAPDKPGAAAAGPARRAILSVVNNAPDPDATLKKILEASQPRAGEKPKQ